MHFLRTANARLVGSPRKAHMGGSDTLKREQTQGCACLRNLAISADNHGRIVAAQGVPAVISAIGKHYKSSGVMVRVRVCVRVHV